MARRRWIMAFGTIMAMTQAAPALAQGRIPAITWVANARLSDAAVAVAHAERPTVYYNPRILAELGTEMTAFLMAHEESHIRLGHDRTRTLGLAPEAVEGLLVDYELAADCQATRKLARTNRPAVMAALAWFRARGTWRPDRDHPPASERAATIQSCLNGVDALGVSLSGGY